MFRNKKKRKRKKSGAKYILFFTFCTVIIFAAITIANLDTHILPPVLAIVNKTATNHINASIDYSLQKISKENSLNTSDFIIQTTDGQGMVNSVSVNTMLVNEVCGKLASELSNELKNMGAETINIPIAAMLNIKSFANTGPTCPITILPMGDAVVDYETKFESAGINQISFQLWLRIDSSVQVVNPIQTQDIKLSRKIALVNTIFSGKVPDTYLNNTPVVPLNK